MLGSEQNGRTDSRLLVLVRSRLSPKQAMYLAPNLITRVNRQARHHFAGFVNKGQVWLISDQTNRSPANLLAYPLAARAFWKDRGSS